MCLRPATIVLFFISLLFLLPSIPAAVLLLTGNDIPARLTIGSAHIFFESDTLSLNGRMLRRDVDYRFVVGEGYFDLTALSFSDSSDLRVIYRPLPSWLERYYGRPLPEASSAVPVRQTFIGQGSVGSGLGSFGSKVQLSGAKGFRFSARSSGASEFGQSLDLSISGELTDGVEISGAISDRGFDPTYGTANSRLNELDRLNLKVSSRRLTAQLGDITIANPHASRRSKRVSGASFNLHYPGWHVQGAAARPRGTYSNFALSGQDGFQGPYQVGDGNRALPIVPGSESIWLDGQLLIRGANRDYIINYPTGRVTFNVNHPIDQRSRLEIDYEPLTTNYKKELFAVSGGGQVDDSIFYVSVGMLSEGDDKEQLIAGDLSESDLSLLRDTGDSTATRSGVTPDSLGPYHLIADSLSDTVYQFVGEGNGEYRVVFSFVGSGKGEYRFLGDDNYQYVGADSGDYVPAVTIPSAERTSYYNAIFGIRNRTFGEFRMDLSTSDHDRNLWSSRDDNDNEGLYYELTARKEWQVSERINSLVARRRIREIEYDPRERISRADFNRDFLIPAGFVPSTTESLHDIKLSTRLSPVLSLDGSYANLDYRQAFSSDAGRIRAELMPLQGVRLTGGWNSVSANLTDNSGAGIGDKYVAAVIVEPFPSAELSAEYERDRRENDYFQEQRGTRYDQVRLRFQRHKESAQYELFVEDSLSINWREVLKRNRFTAASARRLGALSYDATFSYQWLQRPDRSESAMLNRLNLRYNDIYRRISVTTTYVISEEQRNARGITYLEVEQGQGGYSLEDGQFVPDPDGDFIQVEEILSAHARVRRGEKSFHFNKDWRLAHVRLTSRIVEELLDDGKRNAWWILPFVSDENQPYLFYNRRYDADFRLFPIRGFYAANLKVSQDIEKRDVAGSVRTRRDTKAAFSLKQAIITTYLEGGVEFFSVDRDSYFAGSGDIDGYRIAVNARQTMGRGEISLGGGYRYAENVNEESSRQYAVKLALRLTAAGKGEFRFTNELYRQVLSSTSAVPSFQLTDNRSGERGALWSVSFNHGVRAGTRVNFSLNGRHANNRTARITARGEMVTGF